MGGKYQKKQLNEKEITKCFEALEEMDYLFAVFEYPKAFKAMQDLKTGDCWEQSFFLAALLIINSNLNNKYKFFLCQALPSENQILNSHSFLILINRNYNIPFTDDYKESIKPKNLISLINDNQGIIADPWRGLIFTDITKNKHPCNYNNEMINFQKVYLFLTDIEENDALIEYTSKFKHHTINPIQLKPEKKRLDSHDTSKKRKRSSRDINQIQNVYSPKKKIKSATLSTITEIWRKPQNPQSAISVPYHEQSTEFTI